MFDAEENAEDEEDEEEQEYTEDEENDDYSADQGAAKLKTDLFALSWMKVMKAQHCRNQGRKCQLVCSGILMVFLLCLLQGVLLTCVWFATSNTARAQRFDLQETFNDAVGNMGTAGFPLLSEQEAKEICGDYGDDYNDGNVFSYKKLPLGNWDIFSMPSNSRSNLDDAIFVWTAFSRYSTVFWLVSLLWWLVLIIEAMDIVGFCYTICMYRYVTDKSKTSTQSGFSDYQLSPLGNSLIENRSLSSCKKWSTAKDISIAKSMGAFIVVARIIVIVCLAISGCALLKNTHDIVDLVLNSVALMFVVQIDELLVPIFAPIRFVQELEETIVGLYQPVYMEKIQPCVVHCKMFPFVWAVLPAFLGAMGLRHLQVIDAREMFYLTASLCLFAGPTPDITQEYGAGFPVAGMCETLLNLSCTLPGNWIQDQCLRLQSTDWHPDCQYYEKPYSTSQVQPNPIGLEQIAHDKFKFHFSDKPYNDWRQKLHGFEFCTRTNGENVSSLFNEPYAAQSMASDWIDPTNALRRGCLSMWSEYPAMEVNASSHSNEALYGIIYGSNGIGFFGKFDKRFSASPPGDHSGFAPFPRMRRFTSGISRFSAPVQCSTKVLRKVLFDTTGDPATPAQLITNWPNLQSGCAQALVMTSSGTMGSLCDSPYACKTGRCAFSHDIAGDFLKFGMLRRPSKMDYSWGHCTPCTEYDDKLLNVFKEFRADQLEIFVFSINQRIRQYSPACAGSAVVAMSSILKILRQINAVLNQQCQHWNARFSVEDNLFFIEAKGTDIKLMPTQLLNVHPTDRNGGVGAMLSNAIFLVHIGSWAEEHLPSCTLLQTHKWTKGTCAYCFDSRAQPGPGLCPSILPPLVDCSRW